MGNSHRGHVEIEIGGKTRLLRFSLGAIAEAQELLGVQDVNEMLNVSLGSAKIVIDLLWVGLKGENPELTREEVAAWEIPMTETSDPIRKAILLSVFGIDEKPEDKPNAEGKKKDLTGKKRNAKRSAK